MIKGPMKPGVLVVEDDLLQAKVIQRILEEKYDVYLAVDTEEAEEIMARVPELRVLLCDQQMPGELGLDYCRRLQKRTSPLVRIMMTGNIDHVFLLEAINSQALFHYLVKPFDQEALHDVIRKGVAFYEERENEILKQLADEKMQSEQHSVLRRMGQIGQMIVGVGSMALITILIVLVVSAGVGLLLLLVLYFLKSFLGIDMFKDSHFSDWF